MFIAGVRPYLLAPFGGAEREFGFNRDVHSAPPNGAGGEIPTAINIAPLTGWSSSMKQEVMICRTRM
jgi:hypothetical protein